MDAYRTTVDLVAAIAWPVAVGGLVGFFLHMYRLEVAGLLRRVRALQTPWVSVATDQEVPKDVGKVVEEVSKITGEKGAELAKAASTGGEWEQKAIEYQRALMYEQVYRVIYGTQLQLLEDLNLNLVGASADELNDYYQLHVTSVRSGAPSNASYHIPREQFLSFLTNWGLVQVIDNRYVITEFGQGFLQYLTRGRIPRIRPY